MHRRVSLQLARFGAVGATNTALTFVVYAVASTSGSATCLRPPARSSSVR